MDVDGDMARIAELESDNRRLRRLLEQRDAPAELRHRLNNTLAVLRVIIRRSAAGKKDLEAYVGHLEDRLTAIARAQAAIDSQAVVDLHSLVAEELHQYGASEGGALILRGPPVQLQPRAGQVMALAIHELAVNAVEHGGLGVGAGRIEVSWSVSDDRSSTPELRFTWKEVGSPQFAQPATKGFGAEVLTEMLRYELKAETELHFSGDGATCTIRVPLTDRVGTAGEAHAHPY